MQIYKSSSITTHEVEKFAKWMNRSPGTKKQFKIRRIKLLRRSKRWFVIHWWPCSAISNLNFYISMRPTRKFPFKCDNYLDPIAASFIKKVATFVFSFTSCYTRLQLEEAKHEKISAEDKLATTLYKLKVLIYRQNNWNRCSLRSRTDLRFYYLWQWPAWKYSIYAQKWKTSMLAIAQNPFPLAMTYLPMK